MSSDALRSIILATDFSPRMRAAGRYAGLLARHYDAELIVAHAFHLQQAAMEAEELGHVRSRQREQLEHRLSGSVEELALVAPKSVSFLGEGDPSDVIDRLLRQHRPAMIVLGTHGAGTIQRHIISSLAEGILRSVTDPVLTVGPHVAMPPEERLAFGHILYATDFSQAAAQAACHACEMARSFGSKLDVLHVVPELTAEDHDGLVAKERQFLAALGELGREHAFRSAQMFVESGSAAQRILEHARAHDVDLIVLGAHHHSRLARHLRTGPAFQIILRSTCPVLTLCAD